MISTPAQITIVVSNLINLKALEYFPAQRSILITQPLVLTILLFMHLALVAIHDVLPEKVVHLLVCIDPFRFDTLLRFRADEYAIREGI